LNIEKESLKHGLLSLVIALVEVIRDALEIEASKRVDMGDLMEQEVERLGKALIEIDEAIEYIKIEQGITESVREVREGLDNIVDEFIDKMVNAEGTAYNGEEKAHPDGK